MTSKPAASKRPSTKPKLSTAELIWAARALANVSDAKADQLFRDNAAARDMFDQVRAFCAKFIKMH
jgi:hypothetical protein